MISEYSATNFKEKPHKAKLKGQNAFIRVHQRSYHLLLSMVPSGMPIYRTCLWTGGKQETQNAERQQLSHGSGGTVDTGTKAGKTSNSSEEYPKRDQEEYNPEEPSSKQPYAKKPKVTDLSSSLKDLDNKAIADTRLSKLISHISESNEYTSSN
jgi:hypothetical protein